jgi:hypothetical protein
MSITTRKHYENQGVQDKRSSGPGSLASLLSDEVGCKYKYEICNMQILKGRVLPDGLGFELMF